MDGIISGAIGCCCLALAGLTILPLLLLSPLVIMCGGPQALLGTWGIWFALLVYGLGYSMCSGALLYDWTYRRTIQRRQHLAEKRARIAAEKLFVARSSPSTPTALAPGPRPILTPRTPTTIASRPSSIRFATPAQLPSTPSSRRPSLVAAEHDEALHLASTFRANIRENDTHYKYDVSLDGASRLSSRRPSRAGTDLSAAMGSGSATPRIARSRAGSFSFDFGAMTPSRNGSTSNLMPGSDSSKRQKCAHVESEAA